MADPVALASVGTSAIVAITVPWVNSRFDQRRVRLQASAARVDELRTVMDQAAIALAQCLAEIDASELAVEKSQSSGATDEDERRTAGRLGTLGRALCVVEELDQRLAVRLGSRDHLLASFRAAQLGLRAAENILVSAAEAGPSSDEDAWREVVGPLASERKRIRHEQQSFVDSASTMFGPQM
jgi:hypothetical protein